MSWTFYLISILFFTLVFLVFFVVAYSVMLGVQENYRRYYQKASLQWTGSGKLCPTMRYWWFFPLSLFSAWGTVHFLIAPNP